MFEEDVPFYFVARKDFGIKVKKALPFWRKFM